MNSPVLPVFHVPLTGEIFATDDTLVKSRAIWTWIVTYLGGGMQPRRVRRATVRQLRRVHAPEYIEAVRTGEPRALAGSSGLGWDEQRYLLTTVSTGAIIAAAVAAWRERTVTGATSSGLHHACHDHGAGYCTFNGLVVAAMEVLAAGANRILIVDLDAHCGGGTASLIESVPGIEQVDVSVIAYDTYESRPDARVEIVGADGYLDAVRRALAAVEQPGTIDLVIFNAGMDVHEDAGGIEGIDDSVVRMRDRIVMRWAEAHDLPLAFTAAGGYLSPYLTMDGVAALHGITYEEAMRSIGRRHQVAA